MVMMVLPLILKVQVYPAKNFGIIMFEFQFKLLFGMDMNFYVVKVTAVA